MGIEADKALVGAAKLGDIGGMRAALAEGTSEMAKYHALCGAIRSGQGAVVIFLVECGAISEAEALSRAVKEKNYEIFDLVLEHCGHQSEDKKLAAQYACKCDNVTIIRFLIKEKNLDLSGNSGKFLLEIAAEFNSINVIRELLRYEIEVNGDNNGEIDPLGASIRRTGPAAAYFLLEARARIEPRHIRMAEEAIEEFKRNKQPKRAQGAEGLLHVLKIRQSLGDKYFSLSKEERMRALKGEPPLGPD